MTDDSPEPNADSNRDEQLVRQILKHQASVYRVLFSWVGKAADAEDLLQQTMVTVWKKRDTCDVDDVLPWSISIAKNHARNFLRKASRQKTDVGLDPETLDRVAEAQQNLLAESDARQLALRFCLEQLPAERRRLLNDHYDQQMTPQELSARHGKRVDAIYKLLQRIRRTLYDCISKRVAEAGTS